MTGVRAGRIPQVTDEKPIQSTNFRLDKMSALDFLHDITDVVDSNPVSARYSITYVDRFKMQRYMILEVMPLATRSKQTQ
jgi:hypothetical protein